MAKSIIIVAIFFLCSLTAFADNTIVYTNAASLTKPGIYFDILNDPDNKYDSVSILSANNFSLSNKEIPVFSMPTVNVWLRFSLNNKTTVSNLYFFIEHYNISKIKLYKQVNRKLVLFYKEGNSLAHFSDNTIPDYISNLHVLPGGTSTFYIKLESYHPVILSTFIGTYKPIMKQSEKQFFILSVYLGILLVIFLYNLFLFFITNDRNYLLYVAYIFFLGLAQFTLSGYMFKYLWVSNPSINYFAVPVTSSLAAIFGVLFSLQFLRTNYYTPVFHKLLVATIILNILSIAASLFKLNAISYILLDFNTIAVGMLVIIAAIIVIFKGYRPALFYAISWILFLAGLIIFSLRNFDMLPANSFTNYILYFGSAIEAILLSVALADRINVLKKEKDQSQAEALKQARENEQLVSQQNVLLEEKVTQRTAELQSANNQLSEAIHDLKDTQTQLVEAEKMASLGQLTAGIAHEINNPINFVKSNINPLRLDVNDLRGVLNAYDELHEVNDPDTYSQKLNSIQALKEELDISFIQKEIDSLIVGIEEGAERTAEIVRGLRTFSRIDESALKKVNVHDGILSTIVLLKNNIPYYIKLVKEFNAAGEIECFPGKLNQVFMNIITNAIQAIKGKAVISEEEYIIIETRDIEGDEMEISIKDSGPGMTEDVRKKIFEPFFTTKEVGEGIGLGMSIVFKIIQKHSGKINIISAPNEGAEFIITLPHKYEGTE